VVEQLTDHVAHARPGAGDQHAVEGVVRRPHSGAILDAHVVIHLRHVALELGEVARRETRHGDADRDCLERDPHDVELFRVGAEQLGDAHAAVRRRDHEALSLQHAQRLAQRSAPDVEVARQRHLRGRLARRDLAAKDRRPQPFVYDRDVLAVSRGSRSGFCHLDTIVRDRPSGINWIQMRSGELSEFIIPNTEVDSKR